MGNPLSSGAQTFVSVTSQTTKGTFQLPVAGDAIRVRSCEFDPGIEFHESEEANNSGSTEEMDAGKRTNTWRIESEFKFHKTLTGQENVHNKLLEGFMNTKIDGASTNSAIAEAGSTTSLLKITQGHDANFEIGQAIMVNNQMTFVSSLAEGDPTTSDDMGIDPPLNAVPSVSDVVYAGIGYVFQQDPQNYFVIGKYNGNDSTIVYDAVLDNIEVEFTPRGYQLIRYSGRYAFEISTGENTLKTAMDNSITTMELNRENESFEVGSRIMWDDGTTEIAIVDALDPGGQDVTLTRGAHGTSGEAHPTTDVDVIAWEPSPISFNQNFSGKTGVQGLIRLGNAALGMSTQKINRLTASLDAGIVYDDDLYGEDSFDGYIKTKTDCKASGQMSRRNDNFKTYHHYKKGDKLKVILQAGGNNNSSGFCVYFKELKLMDVKKPSSDLKGLDKMDFEGKALDTTVSNTEVRIGTL